MTSTLPNDNIRNFDDHITNKLISEIIRDRIKNSGKRFSANDNIANFESPITLFPGFMPIQHSPRIGTKWCEHADLTEIGPTV